MSDKNRARKLKDGLIRIFIYLASGITGSVLIIIIAFVLYKGLPGVNMKFLTRMWDDVTFVVEVDKNQMVEERMDSSYVSSLGVDIALKEGKIIITDIEKGSPVKEAINIKQKNEPLKKHDIIERVGKTNLIDYTIEETMNIIEKEEKTIELKVRRPGGGIVPMLISTIYIIFITLLIAVPIGVGAAIYLNEYAKPGKVLNIIRFAIQNLAGIPSIIYGLFGMLVFVQLARMQYSILAGSLTLSIMLLPTIISTTEESLKEIPMSYRQGSYGLGASKLQTISKIILPSATPGILVAIILSIGRIVGESAALIWTAGTTAQIPTALTGSKAAAGTLTTRMYWLIKEASDLDSAASIAVVLIVLVVSLNMISKHSSKGFLKKNK